MIVDCNKYRVNYEPILKLTRGKTQNEAYQLISLMAIATGVPVVVVACYVGEIHGFSEALDRRIAGLMQFYHITDVVGVKRGGVTWAGQGHPVRCKCEVCND